MAAGLALANIVPVPSPERHLENYGVKERTVAPTVISGVASHTPTLREKALRRITELVPFIRNASAGHNIPENVLAAVLYEEIVHRKPVDLKTFGVAQLGVKELELNGLPPDPNLLESDELSVWLLATKLRRLQNQTGSLRDAIILHNGYYDFHKSVAKTAKDLSILSILNAQNVYDTLDT
ncbi:MAG: hypothetical protein ACO22S_06970 [Burkholderiaceae bacterium]